ncbi:hypothetical protein DB347_01255 [Opitutaceae bacterium EW11]|nr:hypothetical protein DB347_01255 [Opitutaceae bacterium EW11]
MIVNLDKFIAEERPKWLELDVTLERLARDPWRQLTVDEARNLERLYQRASADLARLATFAAEPETRGFLERLVARGYAEIHGAREGGRRFRLWHWFTVVWPNTFRRRIGAFGLAVVLTLVGVAFGGFAAGFDPDAKEVLLPFAHLQGDPSERVAREEQQRGKDLSGHKAAFSGQLMTHNTQVTLTAVGLGMTYGVGTIVLLFYNGVILGAVAVDYLLAGQGVFLAGWLLPHGTVEIPAILVGGQAGLVLASALLGRGRRAPLSSRLREVAPDVVTLCFGAALMLVWAGVVEAFLSQYHEPVIPYWVKIVFGLVEATALTWFLARAGRNRKESRP